MVGYDPGQTSVEYEPEPIRIEASQKGWLLTRALAIVLNAITHIEADHPHNWEAYYEAKEGVLCAFEQFERWHGRGYE